MAQLNIRQVRTINFLFKKKKNYKLFFCDNRLYMGIWYVHQTKLVIIKCVVRVVVNTTGNIQFLALIY